MKSVFNYMNYRKEFYSNFLLKLSTFGEFNDPFEMIPGHELLKQDSETINFILENDSSEGDSYYENYIDIMAGSRASLGVMYFTSKVDNLLMWSHYANNHEGICVEFDREARIFNGKYKDSGLADFEGLEGYNSGNIYDNVGTLKKVEYSNKRPLIWHTSELISDTKSWLVKSKEWEWEYEDEYRLILPTDRAEQRTINGKDMLFYKMDINIIKSIIMGCQVEKSTKKEIFKFCSDLNICLKESFISPTDYKLDIIDYSPENHAKYINMYNVYRLTK